MQGKATGLSFCQSGIQWPENHTLGVTRDKALGPGLSRCYRLSRRLWKGQGQILNPYVAPL
eukprot:6448463-Prorocentrum_lima.AAC.1